MKIAVFVLNWNSLVVHCTQTLPALRCSDRTDKALQQKSNLNLGAADLQTPSDPGCL